MQITPYFSEKPWAGNYINNLFGLPMFPSIGEAFLVSTLRGFESAVNGDFLSLKIGERLPYLIKIIDAADSLSVQVHPNDYWARILEDSVGKTECWLVIDAQENSGVYYGFKDGHDFKSMMDTIKMDGDASTCLNFVPVKKGDFIEVPAGTIHAIGAGVKILEFQQSSGITYRIWDWNRPGRELHLEKAEKVTNSRNQKPHLRKFDQIPLGTIFFRHDDFMLRKYSHEEIECGSPNSSFRFKVNIENLTCEKN